MKLSEFYKRVIKSGIAKDPREKKTLIKQKQPYADTQVLYGKPDSEVRRLLVGIDIDTAELLIAERIRQKDALDLVVSHHPEGRAWANFFEVMLLQVKLLTKLGVLEDVAAGLLEERKAEVERRILPANHQQVVDAARLLDIPFLCIHTPADNFAADFVQRLINNHKAKRLGDILALLNRVPEYAKAVKDNAGPKIILGSPNRAVGKVFVEMTGGTEGSKEVFGRLYKLGVRTLVSMHLSEEHFKKVKDEGLNVLVAGHVSSDTLGLNLLLDNIEKTSGEKFEVIGCSGFTRITHNGIR